MYKLKAIARRGSALAGAVGLLAGIGTSALPSLASADTLNPLTERSLTLSSSAPGWSYTDGSGNSLYAPPNGGSNGKQTGNFFSFRVSSAKTVKAFTFQYCTLSAGKCQAPGNDTGNFLNSTPDRGADSVAAQQSDLNIVSSSPSEVSGANYALISNNTSAIATGASGATSSAYGEYKQVPDGQNTFPTHSNNPANAIGGNFVVLTGNSATGYVDTYSGGWTMTAGHQEESTTVQTGKNNMITLTNSTGKALNPGDYVKIVFWGTDTNYITNPGQGAFFVKINDYDVDGTTGSTSADINPITAGTHIVDGGVTVANVMNQSISIQTKVLETMDFSVGTVDPDTLKADNSTSSELYAATTNKTHGQCDPIKTRLTTGDAENVLFMGNSNSEHALETANTYGTHSYWRLSSNSSGGATVYYAGNTLYNTEGDRIAPIGPTATAPHLGTEQFGLAIDNDTTASHFYVNHDNANDALYDYGADSTTAKNGSLDDVDATYSWNAVKAGLNAHDPQLYPLVPTTNYSGGGGLFNPGTDTVPGTTAFAFDNNSNTIPVAIASENSEVVNCVTAKMRYIANIAATTPAGIYTTKINYIAAPQY
jgi:hypothetical protein